jgi:hypothetical protein
VRANARLLTGVALIATGVVTTAVPSARGDVIQGVTVADFSSQLDAPTNFRRAAVHAVDGSGGVPVNSYTGTHTNGTDEGGVGIVWLTTGNGAAGGGVDPHIAAADGRIGHIVFDLGGLYDVTQFRVWNYNEGNVNAECCNTRDANAVTIHYSETDPLTGLSPAGGTTLAGVTNLTAAPGTNDYAGDNYDFDFRARYVRIDITNNLGDANQFTGLSEIRFDGTLVPEPASTAVLALGAAGLLRGRRRR